MALTNASHFEVQRSSDAKNFEPIGNVGAKGESKVLINYTFSDKAPLPNTNYYRLKQVDLDGTYSFSKTISILSDAGITISVYPNPATEVLNVESGTPVKSLEVFRANGSKVQGIVQASGTNFQKIDLHNQPPGIYVLMVNGQSFRVLKN
ncbi:MAG: T9SS type A sorting domain-containing protein [Dyadobacter sp.]|uniref:T9SS type A sorting domain-containing protein n=1 Tax=Dyadobacter sp. TaxID=1914288 RepID=UPI001B191552|nr:T9SS type A sorting domain-containing protein [Dyadobacter sp.]MBO9614321.1 T9SS type A sorting domain-containing protein [Dyadobacter sp.]